MDTRTSPDVQAITENESKMSINRALKTKILYKTAAKKKIEKTFSE